MLLIYINLSEITLYYVGLKRMSKNRKFIQIKNIKINFVSPPIIL